MVYPNVLATGKDELELKNEEPEHTNANYKDIYNRKNDPFIEMAIEKLKPLINGLNLYKNSNSY